MDFPTECHFLESHGLQTCVLKNDKTLTKYIYFSHSSLNNEKYWWVGNCCFRPELEFFEAIFD